MTENSAPVRVAVIGAGYWGKNIIRSMNSLGSLAAICDSEEDRRKAFAEQYPECRIVSAYSDILEDKDIPAVAVATPAESHSDFVRKALLAGKDVFVEKPLCLSPETGRELVALAESRGLILMVGHLLWYHPAVLKLKAMIDEGALGRIQYVYSNRLNLGKIRREENILWSFAPHDISVILGLLGEIPDHVSAHGGNYLHSHIADVTVSVLSFPSGVKAHVFVSWLHPFKEQKLVVVGEKKMAVFDDVEKENKLMLYPHSIDWKNKMPIANKAEAQAVEIENVEPLREECAHFLDCVAKRVTPRTDGKEGLRVLTVLERCQRAMDLETAQEAGSQDEEEDKHVPGDFFVHESACVDDGARIGKGTKIWHYSHVQAGSTVGANCSLGQNVNIANDVVMGNNVKIQNNVSLYKGTVIEDDVFLGPSCVLTNVSNPRSQVSRRSVYEKTLIRRGATIGANSTIVCGVEIGRYAFVAAGAVVTKDIADYALVRGNPARAVGWISRHGHPLSEPDEEGIMVCPESKLRYKESEPGVLRCLDVDEEDVLPEKLAVGKHPYRSFKEAQQ
jgi:UDP-2-acetamido-3-amino-2,3-dideoxy-glucuronate N-acetyltransferase